MREFGVRVGETASVWAWLVVGGEREEGVGRGRSLSREGNASRRGVRAEEEEGIQKDEGGEESTDSLVGGGAGWLPTKFCSPVILHAMSTDWVLGGEEESWKKSAGNESKIPVALVEGIAKSPGPPDSEGSPFEGAKVENNEVKSVSVENLIMFSSSVDGETAVLAAEFVVRRFSSSEEWGDFLAMFVKWPRVSCWEGDIFWGTG